MKPTIFAFSGKMFHGKTTMANYVIDVLRARHGAASAYPLHFADPLKADIEYKLGFTPSQVADKSPYMRKLMQAYGQAKRQYDVDYWVKRMLMKIASYHDMYRQTGNPRALTVDDMRFPNELEALAKTTMWEPPFNLVVVRVLRMTDGTVSKLWISDDPGAHDESEKAFDSHSFKRIVAAPSGKLNMLRAEAHILVEEAGL